MIYLLLLIDLFVAVAGFAQSGTKTLTFNTIPYNEPDLIAPGRGAEQWHSKNEINVPFEDSTTQRLDVYSRFTWNRLETTPGNYTWSYFDEIVNEVIRKGQKFSFGIMTCYPDGKGDGILHYDGASSAYPKYLHDLMQKEAAPDWKSKGPADTSHAFWVPNYNSENYLTRLYLLHKSLNDHIKVSTYNGVKYKDVIGYIDIRGYGSWVGSPGTELEFAL